MANPNDIRVLFDQALRKHQAGHMGGAEKLYRRILDIQPKHRDSLHLLGVVRFSEKKYKDAVVLIEKALALGSDVAAICFNLARAYEEDGQFAKALALFERAELKDSTDPDISFGKGSVLLELKEDAAALAAFERALKFSPRHTDALNSKGIALKNLGRLEEALASYVAAIQSNPKHSDSHINRAKLLEAQHRLDDALDGYIHILGYDPKHANAWYLRGKNLAKQKRHVEAIACFVEANALEPQNFDTLATLLVERNKICEWIGFEKNHSNLQRGLSKTNAAVPPLTVARLFDAPELCLKAARTFSEEKLKLERKPQKLLTGSARKLRLGYVSSDLQANHPVFQAIAGVLQQHDRQQFDIHYFLLPHLVPQPVPALITGMGDTVHKLQDASDAEMIAQMREAELDIVVDLNGFTLFNKMEVLLAGVAPILVNYLGSPGSMGSIAHDYIIGDATLLPAESFQHISEKVVWMPDCFFPVNSARPVANEVPTRGAAGLPELGTVFGYFGMADRILPNVFASWMHILKSVEDSVLWLKVANTIAQDNLLKEAARYGIAQNRIVFAQRTESNADHLARLGLMDICLDTLPYNAHMTALDCLFAGVPVLSLQGKTFAARVASSLLTACGMKELICEDRRSYEETAIRLAKSPHEVESLKERLKKQRHSTPLFDTLKYTRSLEKAYTMMVERRAAGLEPEHFGVL